MWIFLFGMELARSAAGAHLHREGATAAGWTDETMIKLMFFQMLDIYSNSLIWI
jgi:hypothetical protein